MSPKMEYRGIALCMPLYSPFGDVSFSCSSSFSLYRAVILLWCDWLLCVLNYFLQIVFILFRAGKQYCFHPKLFSAFHVFLAVVGEHTFRWYETISVANTFVYA